MLKKMFGEKKPQFVATPAYHKWRAGIFTLKPENAGVSADEAGRVFGMLMDVGIQVTGKNKFFVLTTTAFLTGESTFMPSPGGGKLGLGSIPEINQIARDLVEQAQTLLEQTQPTEDLSVPEAGMMQFYLMTTNGLHVYRTALEALRDESHPFLPLLIGFTRIRQISEQMGAAPKR